MLKMRIMFLLCACATGDIYSARHLPSSSSSSTSSEKENKEQKEEKAQVKVETERKRAPCTSIVPAMKAPRVSSLHSLVMDRLRAHYAPHAAELVENLYRVWAHASPFVDFDTLKNNSSDTIDVWFKEHGDIKDIELLPQATRDDLTAYLLEQFHTAQKLLIKEVVLERVLEIAGEGAFSLDKVAQVPAVGDRWHKKTQEGRGRGGVVCCALNYNQGSMQVFDCQTNRIYHVTNSCGPQASVVFAQDVPLICQSNRYTGACQIRNWKTDRLVHPGNLIRALHLPPDTTFLEPKVFGDVFRYIRSDNKAVIFDGTTATEKIFDPQLGYILAISPQGRFLHVASGKGFHALYDTTTQQEYVIDKDTKYLLGGTFNNQETAFNFLNALYKLESLSAIKSPLWGGKSLKPCAQDIPIDSGIFSSNGRYFSGKQKGDVFDVGTCSDVLPLPSGQWRHFTPHNQLLFITDDSTFYLYNFDTKKKAALAIDARSTFHFVDGAEGYYSIALSNDELLYAAPIYRGTIATAPVIPGIRQTMPKASFVVGAVGGTLRGFTSPSEVVHLFFDLFNRLAVICADGSIHRLTCTLTLDQIFFTLGVHQAYKTQRKDVYEQLLASPILETFNEPLRGQYTAMIKKWLASSAASSSSSPSSSSSSSSSSMRSF